MFGLGWSEMLVIGIVALIVIGPKDLPQVFRMVGEFTGKARGMAREFSRAMNDAAKDSGLNDVSKSLKAASNPKAYGLDKVKEATGMTYKPGSETAKLSEERQAAKEKLTQAMGKAATDRQAREAAAAKADASAKPTPAATKPTPAKKTAAKKPADTPSNEAKT
jgi:sec-independent protein translocase protein TatB